MRFMSASTPASEAALLGAITTTCVALAIGSVIVWFGVFLMRLRRLRLAQRDAAAEEEITSYVLDQLSAYSSGPAPTLPPWKRAILARVLQSLIEQTKGRDQTQLVQLLQRCGFHADALQLIARGNAGQRQRACALLGHFDDEASVAALRAALTDRDAGIRLVAARALLAKDRVPSLGRLLEQLRFDRDDPPLSLAELFVRLPSSLRPEAIALLETDLPPEWLRMLAIALARAQVHEAFDAIGALRRHSAPRVRAAAWVALRELGDPRAGDLVAEGLGDPVTDVRRAAAECAGQLGTSALLPALKTLGSAADWWTSYAAAAALWDLGPPGHELLQREHAFLAPGARQFWTERQEALRHG